MSPGGYLVMVGFLYAMGVIFVAVGIGLIGTGGVLSAMPAILSAGLGFVIMGLAAVTHRLELAFDQAQNQPKAIADALFGAADNQPQGAPSKPTGGTADRRR